jgi:hypothetical protein
MLAPYLSVQFYWQSDFGHPAGAVVGDMIVSDFRCFGLPQNRACGADRSGCTAVQRLLLCVFAGTGTD